MGPHRQDSWPAGAPQTEEDTGHLFSTLAARLRLGTPRIIPSVEIPCQEKNASFELQCLMDHYAESVVWESTVRSLKGAAVYMVWYMGPTTSMIHILAKIGCHFWHHGVIQCPDAKFLQGYPG